MRKVCSNSLCMLTVRVYGKLVVVEVVVVVVVVLVVVAAVAAAETLLKCCQNAAETLRSCSVSRVG